MTSNGNRRDHAVVIGGSVAGLLAARAAAPHFKQVTLLERNLLTAGAATRKGVPQSAHAHAMLVTGRRHIEQFFPGFGDELVARGALRNDLTGDTVRYVNGALHLRRPSGFPGLLASRTLIESVVRGRLAEVPNVTIRSEADVAALVLHADRRSVAGVRLRAQADQAEGELIAADLVIDAAGRGSRLPEWLRTLGLSAPPEERLQVDITYTTQWLQRTPGQLNGTASMAIGDGLRSALLLAQEDGRWVLTLAAYGKQAAAADSASMRRFADALPMPDISTLLAQSAPLAPATLMHFPHNQRRRYEQLRDLPDGVVVCGDAFCSFNPIYGQGMSVAAMQASALAAALEGGDADACRRYLQAAAKVIDAPWSMGARNDALLLGLGTRTRASRAIDRYLERLHRSATVDLDIALALLQVVHLVNKPASLFTPSMIWRSWRQSRRAAA
jgi:2-polyprenyl-6-methoxyphenol hydroxylase-like FAD-dependent oxidoreductase